MDLVLDDVDSQDLARSVKLIWAGERRLSLSARCTRRHLDRRGFRARLHQALGHDFLDWVVSVDDELGHESRAFSESVRTRHVGSVWARPESARSCHAGRVFCFSTKSKARAELKPQGQTSSADEVTMVLREPSCGSSTSPCWIAAPHELQRWAAHRAGPVRVALQGDRGKWRAPRRRSR